VSKSVLFVCLGNICRSPAAEGVMRKMLRDASLEDRIAVDSAGTMGYHTGKPADARMRTAAARRGYDLTSRARQLSGRDLSQFDLIVAMDAENFREINRLADGPAPHVRMLSDFLSSQSPSDVPDPYYGGEEGFEQVLDMIEAACPKIIAHMVGDSTS
jgi:protein-tyrosine phosphatase